MKVEIDVCDHCSKVTTDMGRTESYGYTLVGKLELHKKLRTDCGSSSKAGYGRGLHFCSEQCLSSEINRMLRDAHVQLQVVPVLKEIK